MSSLATEVADWRPLQTPYSIGFVAAESVGSASWPRRMRPASLRTFLHSLGVRPAKGREEDQ